MDMAARWLPAREEAETSFGTGGKSKASGGDLLKRPDGAMAKNELWQGEEQEKEEEGYEMAGDSGKTPKRRKRGVLRIKPLSPPTLTPPTPSPDAAASAAAAPASLSPATTKPPSDMSVSELKAAISTLGYNAPTSVTERSELLNFLLCCLDIEGMAKNEPGGGEEEEEEEEGFEIPGEAGTTPKRRKRGVLRIKKDAAC